MLTTLPLGTISMPNILVTGANGQLGSEIHTLSSSYPQYNFTFADRSTLDLSNLCTMEDYFEDKTFDTIINCAAYTAVDKAESESDLANTINHRFVSMLSKIAKKKNISLIHMSTDYVFDGKSHRPYIETDPTDPQGVYGRTKCDGEKAILETAPANCIIIRTSWVYSSFGNNFVQTMLRLGKERDTLGVIFDQVGTPTYARNLAQAILDILPQISNTTPEIYHYSNEGAVSWYDFAKAIFELSGIECNVNPITTDQYPTPASRPHYSLLNKSKIKNDFGITIPYWRDSLKECLNTLGEIK
jgi:dTDP-4-dehydrorhamnose reductase